MLRGTPSEVGRNDPCPCGSKQKYKKCCGKSQSRNVEADNREGVMTVADSKQIYQNLRNLALRSSRTQLGLPQTTNSNDSWGVIMDWGLDKEDTATIVAFINGAASVYLSSGGGFIGGEKHESVRQAAKRMVTLALQCQPQAKATDIYPLPEQGSVNFYFLTDSGILKAEASVKELRNRLGAFAKLGDAGQDVITQYRLISEKDAK